MNQLKGILLLTIWIKWKTVWKATERRITVLKYRHCQVWSKTVSSLSEGQKQRFMLNQNICYGLLMGCNTITIFVSFQSWYFLFRRKEKKDLDHHKFCNAYSMCSNTFHLTCKSNVEAEKIKFQLGGMEVFRWKNKHLRPPESGTELFLVGVVKYESTFSNIFKMLQNFTEILN